MPMENIVQIHQFTELFLRIINKFKELEKIPIDHGTGDLLYASEVNTLELIGKFPGINLTQLAKKRAVTKGAVSQIVAKLAAKRLVSKNQAEDNDKVIMLELTEKGRIVFVNHEKFHEKYDSPMVEKLNSMSPEQLELILSTFSMLEDTIDTYLNDLK